MSQKICGSVGQWIRKAKSCNIAFSTENLYVCGWVWIFLSVSPTLKMLFQLRTTLLTSTRIFSYLQIEKISQPNFPDLKSFQTALASRTPEKRDRKLQFWMPIHFWNSWLVDIFCHLLCSGDLDVGKYRICRLQVHFMDWQLLLKLRDFSTNYISNCSIRSRPSTR